MTVSTICPSSIARREFSNAEYSLFIRYIPNGPLESSQSPELQGFHSIDVFLHKDAVSSREYPSPNRRVKTCCCSAVSLLNPFGKLRTSSPPVIFITWQGGRVALRLQAEFQSDAGSCGVKWSVTIRAAVASSQAFKLDWGPRLFCAACNRRTNTSLVISSATY